MKDETKKAILRLSPGIALAFGIAIFLVARLPDPLENLLVLVGILGGLFGWMAGIFLSPQNKKEEEEFSSFRAGIATFFGGMTVVELRSAISDNSVAFEQVVYFLIPAGIGFLFTWYGRRVPH